MRKYFINSVLLLVAALVATSCSSIKIDKNNFQITSYPSKAKVSLYVAKTGDYIELGETPYILDEAKVKEVMESADEYFAVRISKEGHVIEHLIIDKKVNSKIKYMAKLKPIEIWTDRTKEISSTIANKLAQKIQILNQNIFQKKFKTALLKVERLIEQYPKAHVFYDIKGSILYLQGKKGESLAAYNKSLSINPDNVDSINMVKQIKK